MKTLCLDFDGVIHSYTSGWQGASLIPDTPVPGAIEFIRDATKHFSVAIFSSRSSHEGGIEAMCDYLNFYGLPRPWISENLKFPTDKPPAWVTLDDRAIQFTGTFPSFEELDAFQPWNKLVKPSAITIGMPDHQRRPTEISLCLASRGISTLDRLQALATAAGATIIAGAETAQDAAKLTDIFTMTLESNMAEALQRPEIKKYFKESK